MSNSMGIKFDMSGLLKGMSEVESKAETAIRMYADNSALQLQNYAREHRPWTDRTGQARQRLSGYSEHISNGYKICLAHGVDYGLWLELAHEKRFSIIPYSIQYVGSHTIMPGFERLIERLNK